MSWRDEFREELTGNILPFWVRHAVDEERGGFHGLVRCDLTVDREAGRSAVLMTRILWTYAAAARVVGGTEYRAMADRAFDYVKNTFWDGEFGGIYWMVDPRGGPVSDRKQIYAQAFAAYAMAEYARATGSEEALGLARRLCELIEEHSREALHGGYIEARARDWSALEDQRLSEKDLNSPKSMNTHLHVLEAYTNLLRVWPDEGLRARQRALVRVMLERIIDEDAGHFHLFFDNEWNSLNDHVSFGHDIEGSWLLVEAAEAVGDAELLTRARLAALRMAEAVYEQGRDEDGSLFYEADGRGALIDAKKHWWAQAEAVVGFYNAYELSGEERYREAARTAWRFIQAKVVDQVHGEWHAKLSPEGRVLTVEEDGDACLAGPWKCPYHNSRVCYEMLERLKS